MRSEAKGNRGRLAASLVLLAALGATGCGHFSGAGPVEEVAIEPAAPARTSDDLGPDVRPLSLGPGDKSSPRISPSGDRIAFVLDGSVVEKSLYNQDLRRRTGQELPATSAEWISEEDLVVLSPEEGAEGDEAGALFFVQPGDRASELASGVQATGTQADGGAVSAIVEMARRDNAKTALLRVWAEGEAARLFPVNLRGRVTGLSLSRDGREAVLAVRIDSGRDAGRVEILTYRFFEEEPVRAALLEEGLELIGAPQRTTRGIYFVASEEGDEEADYTLYRVPEGSEGYEPAREVGEDFVPASVAVSPDGESLAVLGRRNARSPTDLYVLDLASGDLDVLTANENMEIKTKPRDLAWSPGSDYVLLVARGMLPGPKVYSSPARDLSSAFYNIYGVPVKMARVAKGRAG
ncbi:MAG: hypothetical protein AVDCRST_MAG25-177 [uncultured Rubrobacteraceae bacterium]|uniref:Lipoprotein LpqB beta-propeller domain-containing protein n=1 Tax=uncultured Rubrobacteraceae bacterium TaxID=349277 RepID=A0A6J4R1P8_9ACTN|nr:MAG: hypothetical protein AVDCRST_MAG25-177 [uncultured Rubrobacteraceae bacterium]